MMTTLEVDALRSVGVIGAGTWGIALARMLSNSGHAVTVWSATESKVADLSASRIHKNLPDVRLPDEISFTASLQRVCAGKDVLLFAVPSVAVRSVTEAARTHVAPEQLIVDVAKGIEADTLLTMSEVIRDVLRTDGLHDGVKIVALSGPTHAEEVALDMPTAIVSACEDLAAAELVQDVFTTAFMRVYTNTDIKGVELCGALKNIIALTTGISAGLGYGDNAKAALITRGLAEIERLGRKLGCAEQTFSGLAGMGDLIVTATSRHSRNNRAGYLIGRGCRPEEAVRQVGMVVEGINALPAAVTLAKRYDVDMPIVMAADAIINHGADPKRIVTDLMGREKRAERN